MLKSARYSTDTQQRCSRRIQRVIWHKTNARRMRTISIGIVAHPDRDPPFLAFSYGNKKALFFIMTTKNHEHFDQHAFSNGKDTLVGSRDKIGGTWPKWVAISVGFLLLLLLDSIAVPTAAQSQVDTSVAERLAVEALREEQHVDRRLRDHASNIILLEGDSWFDLPWPHTDIVDALEARELTVISVAERGDTLENMAYNDQLSDMIAQLRRISRYGRAPNAILLSFGGNDIVGQHLSLALDHRRSLADADDSHINWRTQIMNGMLDRYEKYAKDYLVAVSFAYDRFFRSLDMDAKKFEGVPIIVHGYGYPSAYGTGFRFLWLFPAKGPWIKPTFDNKMYDDESAIDRAVRELINQFNIRINSIVGELNDSRQIPNPICYVNLRPVIGRNNWSDELHPDGDGMSEIADEFLHVLSDAQCNPRASEWLHRSSQ